MKKGSDKWWMGAIPAFAALILLALFISSCSTPMGNPEEGKRMYSMNH